MSNAAGRRHAEIDELTKASKKGRIGGGGWFSGEANTDVPGMSTE